MKKFLAILMTAVMLVSAVAVCASAAVDATVPEIKTAEAAYGTPVIDGKIDELWSKATVYKYGTDTKTQSADVVGQFRTMWDENYIYFLFEVTDSTMMPEDLMRKDNNWYARDQVAVCFNPANDRTATTGVGTSTVHFWYTYRPDGVVPNFCQAPAGTFLWEGEGAISESLDFEKHPMASRMYAYERTATGYVIEAKVKISARYADWKNEAGKTIDFDTFVYGNDYTADNTAAKADHVYPWADTSITSYKDNSKKGQIKLLEKPAEPTQPATGDNAYIFVIVAVVAVLGTAVVVKRRFN